MTLTPEKRQAIYAAAAALVPLLVTLHVLTDAQGTSALGVLDAVLALAALVLAAVKAKAVAWKSLYGAFAALVATIAAAGWITQGFADQTTSIAATVAAFIPLALAIFRTTAATPTGEPTPEYVARHTEDPALPPAS